MNSQDKALPNVSYCVDNNEVHYNPWVETRVVAKFNVTSTSVATNILYSSATSNYSEIEIDGVVQPSVISSYTFATTGEHTVKYTLIDPTIIGRSYDFYTCNELMTITIPNSVTEIYDDAFYNCSGLTSITIPNSVTAIGEYAFYECTGLTSVVIPNSVTSIGYSAFYGCSNLTNITIQATTPPTLNYTNSFDNTNCPIYVPVESVAAYKAATNWSDLSSRIQAIP